MGKQRRRESPSVRVASAYVIPRRASVVLQVDVAARRTRPRAEATAAKIVGV